MIKIACEAKRIIEHYLVQKDNSMYFNVKKYGVNQKEAERLLNNWHQFDRPDIYSVSSEKIYGIEHFEYDTHGCHKRGSLQQKENNLITEEDSLIPPHGVISKNDVIMAKRHRFKNAKLNEPILVAARKLDYFMLDYKEKFNSRGCGKFERMGLIELFVYYAIYELKI
jgi:hypothetical protein